MYKKDFYKQGIIIIYKLRKFKTAEEEKEED